ICNNSPQYSSLPTQYICNGEQFCFNHGATDSDGDSLVYSLVNPKEGSSPPGSDIPFVSGLSATNPVSTTGSFNFNNETGEMCFTPDTAQTDVISVEIDEYRNGQ
ncbi:MAG: hypothetical protein ABEH43_03435, partial [Flavobacteriales bacterium]